MSLTLHVQQVAKFEKFIGENDAKCARADGKQKAERTALRVKGREQVTPMSYECVAAGGGVGGFRRSKSHVVCVLYVCVGCFLLS
jgi:hypothetical protein